MRKRQLSYRINTLDTEKKVLAIASFATIVACFLPWYGINSRVINEWWNAFSSIGSVAGYALTIFSLATLTLIALPLLKPEWEIEKKLPFKSTSLMLLFSAQSFFVTLLFIPVYAQYSLLNASSSGTRFGMYVALVSTLASSIFAYAYQRKMEKNPSASEEFANVPRTHQGINEWSENEPEEQAEEDLMESENVEQETMFEPYQEPKNEEVAPFTPEEPVQDPYQMK